MSGLSFRAR